MKNISKNIIRFLLVCLMILICTESNAQMERKRAVSDRPVEGLFLNGSLVGMNTPKVLGKRNLQSMVMHNFGLISGGMDTFYGLDQGAVVRLALTYGITDRFMIGLARTSLDNTVDIGAKYILLRQMESDNIPVQVGLYANLGIDTQKEQRFDFTFQERLNYLASLMIARKFSDQFSLQVSPMVSHFNTIVLENTEDLNANHTHAAVGLGLQYRFNNRRAMSLEYIPLLTNHNPGTTDPLALSYEMDTGGHVFQIFIMTGRWFTEQHLMTQSQYGIENMEFRLGFNINRVFGL